MYFKNARSRIFDVMIEDVPVIQDFDIYNTTGMYVAFIDTISLSEKGIVFQDGTLDIAFSGKQDEPKISAIEVIPTRTLPPSLSWSVHELNFGTAESQKILTISNFGNGDLNWEINENSLPAWVTSIQPTEFYPAGQIRPPRYLSTDQDKIMIPNL